MSWSYAFRWRKAGILEERSGSLLVFGLWKIVREELDAVTCRIRSSIFLFRGLT